MYRANAIETSTHARCAFSRSDASVVSGHDLPAVELPQFRQVGDELAGGRLTDARHAAHQVALLFFQSSSDSISCAMRRSRSSRCCSKRRC